MKKLALAGCAVLVAGLSAAQDAPNVAAAKACNASWQSKNLNKIIADCKKAKELNKDWPGANYYMAKAYFSKKDYANSVAQYKTFLKLGESNEEVTAAQKADATKGIGFALWSQKKYGASIPYLTKIVAAEPQNAVAHYRLADAYKATKNDSKAEKHYVKVTQLNPKVAGAYYHAGRLALIRKDSASAKKYLTAFVGKSKGAAAAQANYLLGQIAYEEGDSAATKAHWEAYLAANPKASEQTTAVKEYLTQLDAAKSAGS